MNDRAQRPLGRSDIRPEFPEMCWPVAELSPHLMVAVEGPSRLVRYANRAFCLHLGKEEREMLGRSFDEVVPQGAAQRFSEAIDRVMATREPETVVEEERSLGVSGVPYTHWSLSIWAILSPDGEEARVMIQVTDLTEIAAFRKDSTAISEALLLSTLREHEFRQRVECSNERLSGEIAGCEEERKSLEKIAFVLETIVRVRTDELRQVNVDLHGFMYSIAHNLRAPLRAIVSTSTILRDEASHLLTTAHAELLVRQTLSALKLSSLIDDLLGYSRLAQHPIVRSALDLTTVVNEQSESLAFTFPDRLLNVVVDVDLTVDADGDLVTLAFYLLLDNASKFSPQGGKISVGRQEGGLGAFYVRDEGIGFDMAYGHKLFLPFERLVGESEFPGNGIGLAKVKRIVELHGGKVWAEATLGEGATFFFTLSGETRE